MTPNLDRSSAVAGSAVRANTEPRNHAHTGVRVDMTLCALSGGVMSTDECAGVDVTRPDVSEAPTGVPRTGLEQRLDGTS